MFNYLNSDLSNHFVAFEEWRLTDWAVSTERILISQ